MKIKMLLTVTFFSSVLYSQKQETVLEEVKNKVFFYGFSFDNERTENYSLSIPTSLLTKKAITFRYMIQQVI